MDVHSIKTNWSPPPRDYHKINVDAAYSTTTRMTNLGMIARDTNAKVCVSVVVKAEDVKSPLHAEIKAILFGLQVAGEMNLGKVEVESDFLIAIKEILKKSDSLREWGCILFDVWEMSMF